MTITATRVTISDLLPAHRIYALQARLERVTARNLGIMGLAELAAQAAQLAGELEVKAGQLRRLGDEDRHTRANAAAELAGITDLRDALTALA